MSPVKVSVALPTAHAPASQQLVSRLAQAVPNVGALGVSQSQQNVGPNSAGPPASEANVGELAERIAAAAAAAVAAAPGQDRMTTMAAFTNAAAHLVTLARSFPDPVSTSRIASAVLPTHGPQSNVKVTLPAIKKWGLKCLFDGRDLDLFLTDCQQFARASDQAPAATIILMVSDELRRVLNLQVSQAMSLGKQLTEQEVVASLKELIGYNMHDAKHIAMTRLVHGSVKQRTDQTVLEYAVDFRLEVMRADALPAAVLCDLFVKGLKATIAAQCARTSAGLLWTDVNECITYAVGKEATMPGGSRSGAPVAILSHQDQRKGVDRGHSSFPARGRGRGVQGLMTSDEGHQFKRDGGQWQPVPQGFVPYGGGGRGGPLPAMVSAPRMGVTGVAMAVEAHGEARAVAAKEAQEVVAAREALGVVAVRGDGKEARVASRVAAKAVGKEGTVAKEAVGWVALSSQHLLLRQCFTSLMSYLPQVHATVSIERSVTPVAAKILPEMLEGIDLILGADWQKSHGAVLDVGSNICHIKVGNKLHKLHSQHHKFRPGAAVLAAVADSGEAVKVLSAKQAARALRKGCCSVLALVQPSAANDDEGWYNGSLASVLVNSQEGCERPGLVPASVIDSMVHEEFPTVFQDMPAGLPPDRGVGHTIRLEPGHAPPYQRARRYSLKEMDEMRKQVAELLAKKLIEPSSSPYGAPVLFVQKRDGTLRMCIDFRALNKLTGKTQGLICRSDRYPLPRIDDLFDRVQGKMVFSSLDLQSGYHQIRITPEDVPKTAFVTPGGQFQYKVLCFGLTNAPATFQRVMNRIFEKQLLAGTVLVYLDDILVMSRSPAEHVQHLREVLQVMKDNNLYAKLSKCEFNKPELKFLGHIVGRHGIAVDPAKVQVIQDWAMPTCLKELQAFLGLANFFRRFIAGYNTIAAPLTHLTGEAVAAGTNWRQLSDPAVNAFNALKEALCSAPVLALPDPLQPFEVWSDASLAGTGGVLLQNGRVVAYTSHKFTPAQVKYTTGEQELLGIIRAMQEWRCYLDGAVHVTIVTDHNPLIYLKTQTNLSRRQARWMEFLARFDHHIEYKPGKGNVADPLSRNPGLTHHDDDDDGQPILLTMGAKLCVSGVYAMVMTRRQAGLQVQPPFQPPPVPPSQPAAPRKQKRQQKRARCANGGQPPPSVVPCDKWPDGGEKQLDSATHTPAGKTHSTTQGSSLVKAIINGYSTDDRFADRAYTQAYELSETGLWMSGGKVVVPKSPLVKREVLEACHDANYAGHMGMSKTWHTVDLSFTWPGMRKDVEDYVRQCDACQRNKPSTRLKAGKLQPQLQQGTLQGPPELSRRHSARRRSAGADFVSASSSAYDIQQGTGIRECNHDSLADGVRRDVIAASGGQLSASTLACYATQYKKIRALCAKYPEGMWDLENLDALAATGILNQMRKDYESSPADGMSYSTLRQVHAVLAINYKKRILQRPHVGHPSNLIDDALYKQAYKNLLYVVNGCGKRKEGVESQDQCPAGGITRIQLAEVSLHLVKVPGLSPAFLRSAFTCMWAGISRFDDICQLLLQDLRPPTLLPTVGPLPCYQYGFLFIGGKTNTPNVKRYQSFTRAMNWVVCPVNAIGHFLWYKYVFANWDMPHPDKTKGERDPWLTEAFFCVNKTHRDKAASWQAVADQFKKLKTLFDILIDRVLHSFRKGASYDLYSQGVHLDLIRIVGNWLAPDSMTQAYTTGPSPVVLVQHGDWPEIDNNYLKGYFHERMLIKVPSTAIQGLFPFLKGYEDAACKKRTGRPPARLVAQAMTSIGEVVLQDFIHQTAADQLEGTPPNLTSPLAMHMWSLPEVPVLVNIHINNLKTKGTQPPAPKHPGLQGTQPPAPQHPGLQGTQPPAPQHPGLQGTQPWSPALQGTQPWSPVLQGTQPPAPKHPGLQGTQPPAPQHPGLHGTQPPAPQHPGLPSTQAATASKKQKGSYEWLKHNCSFADMRREWHQGQQGVRPPLKVLDAQPGRPYRVGMGKTFTGQIESFKDGVFGLEVVLEVEGLTVEQVQQQANKQWEEDAARAAKGPNRHRVGRQWSGHVKWLEATFPNCFLAGRLMKKNPTLSAAMAYAKVKQPTEVLPTPSRALKKARVEAGLQSPNAASVRRALQFGESPGAGCDVAACADSVIKHLQEMARALPGMSEGMAYKEVVGGVELSTLSQLATALSLPAPDPAKKGHQGLCGYSLYLAMKRGGVEAQHPGVQPSQITQLIAAAWNGDNKRREVLYLPGDMVLLSTQNMRGKANQPGVRKLKPRYVGPFSVQYMVGKAAVKLWLPDEWSRLHNVFHVSLVKPYRTDVSGAVPGLAGPPPVQWLDGEPQYTVEKVVGHRLEPSKGKRKGKCKKRRLEFLVKWQGHGDEHNTWELSTQLVGCQELLARYLTEHNLSAEAEEAADGEAEAKAAAAEELDYFEIGALNPDMACSQYHFEHDQGYRDRLQEDTENLIAVVSTSMINFAESRGVLRRAKYN
ncbi:hypothetical protein QJQ45_027150 [Haematococcus lacustris]|nr:hypothetical protein QJQ45_027150 [Haematococcus lacustris]